MVLLTLLIPSWKNALPSLSQLENAGFPLQKAELCDSVILELLLTKLFTKSSCTRGPGSLDLKRNSKDAPAPWSWAGNGAWPFPHKLELICSYPGFLFAGIAQLQLVPGLS